MTLETKKQKRKERKRARKARARLLRAKELGANANMSDDSKDESRAKKKRARKVDDDSEAQVQTTKDTGNTGESSVKKSRKRAERDGSRGDEEKEAGQKTKKQRVAKKSKGTQARVDDVDIEQAKKDKAAARAARRAARKSSSSSSPSFASSSSSKSKHSSFADSSASKPLKFDFIDQVFMPLDAKKAKAKADADALVEAGTEHAVSVTTFDDTPVDAKHGECVEFSQLDLPSGLPDVFAGFDKPTPIQRVCWPLMFSGRDVVGVAATGSGKTLGFGIPALLHLLGNERLSKGGRGGRSSAGPRVLVLAPTRELARQIEDVFADAGKRCGVKSVCVFGGVPKWQQRDAIAAGAEVVIGTPGRLLDLYADGALPLGRVTYVVLDEADRMLDLGFMPDIKKMFAAVPSKRQTLMFSATWPESVQSLGAQFLSDPAKVTIGSQELSATHSVEQRVELMDARQKNSRLGQLLRESRAQRISKMIVFVLYKREAPRVEEFCARNGWQVVSIHGDKSQPQRLEALDAFRDGSAQVMVATDVAARGLDIPNVELVINYSFPLTVEDYIHRIGRTGRAGASGIAHTFFTAFDKNNAGDLCWVLREANQPVPPELEAFGPTIRRRKQKEEAPVYHDTSTKVHIKF
jgi:ATP-dependent RNA helicase DBP3